jgi:hypothetical protein
VGGRMSSCSPFPESEEYTRLWGGRVQSHEEMKALNTNDINSVSLRGVPRSAGRRSNPKQDEIAAPFGLAMTVTMIFSFVLVEVFIGQIF